MRTGWCPVAFMALGIASVCSYQALAGPEWALCGGAPFYAPLRGKYDFRGPTVRPFGNSGFRKEKLV